MHGNPLEIAIYSMVVLVLGYWLSVALNTWKHRVTFFLTLLVAAVLVGSKVGIVATAVPTILCIVLFERERGRERRASHFEAARGRAFASFPIQKWNGVIPLVVFDTDQFLYGEEVLDFIRTQPGDAEIRLCRCRPVYMEPVEACDLVDGCDGEFEPPENVQRALDALNDEISECGAVSWEQDQVAIDTADLKERVKAA